VAQSSLLSGASRFANNYLAGDVTCVSLFFSRGNAYWVGLTGLSVADMNKAFADIAKAGGTAVRFVLIQFLPEGTSSRISISGIGHGISLKTYFALAMQISDN
jgi:hypothetical protein